jgi:hypothetical protein
MDEFGPFAVLILTHGRPDRVHTYRALRESGYTGRIVLLIDDEDESGPAYRERFGDEVLVFDKREAAKLSDTGDSSGDRRVVIHARNVSWEIARSLGLRTFLMLDDDYTRFLYRRQARSWKVRSMDAVIGEFLRLLFSTGALSVAMAQGGDLIGGANAHLMREGYKRKIMNAMFMRVDRPFRFLGRINEDVTAYCHHGAMGELFLTPPDVYLLQPQTQQQTGGLTEAYLASGTYLKSFYSVMWCPSFVSIGSIGLGDRRIHHRIDWERAVPKILDPALRKSDG